MAQTEPSSPPSEFEIFSDSLARQAEADRKKFNEVVKKLHTLCSKPSTSLSEIEAQMGVVKMWFDFLQRHSNLHASATFHMENVRRDEARKRKSDG